MQLFLFALVLLCSLSALDCQENEEICVVNEDGSKSCESVSVHKHKYTKEEQQENTDTEDKNVQEKTDQTTKPGLARRDGVEIGHEEEIELQDGRKIKIITKAMRPLLFEIPDFLTDEETEHIKTRALEEGGMFSSRAKGGLTVPSTYKVSGTDMYLERGKAGGYYDDFERWDANKDNVVDAKEVISVVHTTRALIMTEDDVKKMFQSIEEPAFDDGILTKDEFKNMNSIGMEDYVHILYTSDPSFKERHSEQAWLFMEQWVDPLMYKLRERLVKISGLSRDIVYGGERLQVVHYTDKGHYNAHHDSETHERNVPCCHQYKGDVLDSVGECKLCRYITFLFFLNDVEEGGHTAFPVAGDTSYSTGHVRAHGNVSSDKYNLIHNCAKANLLVKPKKNKAVLWYNHLRNETDGWLGEIDLFSLHGGCKVSRGEKWIANMWIPAPYGKAADKPSIYLNKKDHEMAEQAAKVN